MTTFVIEYGEGWTAESEAPYNSFEQFVGEHVKVFGGGLALITTKERLIPWDQVWHIDRLPTED